MNTAAEPIAIAIDKEPEVAVQNALVATSSPSMPDPLMQIHLWEPRTRMQWRFYTSFRALVRDTSTEVAFRHAISALQGKHLPVWSLLRLSFECHMSVHMYMA